MNDDRIEKETIKSAQGIINAILISLPIWGILYFLFRLFQWM